MKCFTNIEQDFNVRVIMLYQTLIFLGFVIEAVWCCVIVILLKYLLICTCWYQSVENDGHSGPISTSKLFYCSLCWYIIYGNTDHFFCSLLMTDTINNSNNYYSFKWNIIWDYCCSHLSFFKGINRKVKNVTQSAKKVL